MKSEIPTVTCLSGGYSRGGLPAICSSGVGEFILGRGSFKDGPFKSFTYYNVVV